MSSFSDSNIQHAAHDLDQPGPMMREGTEHRHVPEAASERAKGCPWRRFWARMLDYLIFGFIIGVIIGLFGITISVEIQPYVGMGVIFVWVFVEAILLCTWGSTPGKALLHTRVRTSEGHKLTFMQALNRSFSVWWLGVGAGIPIISLITMLVASVKLSNNRVTTWDRSGHFVIEHGSVGVVRVVICVILFAFFILLVYGGARG